MNIREQYGNYIKSEHVKAGPIGPLTIASVQNEDMGGEEKPCVFFADHPKALPLNKGNADLLADAFGDETGGWEGKKIEVLFDPNVRFQGKKTGGMVVRPVA